MNSHSLQYTSSVQDMTQDNINDINQEDIITEEGTRDEISQDEVKYIVTEDLSEIDVNDKNAVYILNNDFKRLNEEGLKTMMNAMEDTSRQFNEKVKEREIRDEENRMRRHALEEPIEDTNKIEYVEFEELKISTMTLVIGVNERINKLSVFHTMPVDYHDDMEFKKKSIVYKKHYARSILNSRFKMHKRGPCLKGSFMNAVTEDVCTETKIVSAKISNESLQMCGAASRDDGIQAANIIIERLNHVREVQLYIRDNRDRYNEVVEFIRSHCIGEDCWLEQPVITGYNKAKKLLYIKHVYSPVHRFQRIEFPSHLNNVITSFLSHFIEDAEMMGICYEDMMDKFIAIPSYDIVHAQPLEVTMVREIMVNYNYSAGFSIDGKSLVKVIQDNFDNNKVYAFFDIEFVNYVTINIFYECEDEELSERRRLKSMRTCHTLLIYCRWGSVTQSSGSTASSREPYEFAVDIFTRFRHLIENKYVEPAFKSAKIDLVLDDDFLSSLSCDSISSSSSS